MLRQILLFLLITGIIFGQSYHAKMKSLSINDLKSGDKAGIEKMVFNKTIDEIIPEIKAANINYKVNDGDMYIKEEKMRIDFIEDGKKSSFIIDSKSKDVMMVSWAEKEYMQMNLDEIVAMQEKMQSMMSEKMKEMESMMQNMPPEARAQMEKMMQDRMPMNSKPKEKPTISKTGKTKTIGGFNSEEYIVEYSDSKSQFWVTQSYPAVRKSLENFLKIASQMQKDDFATWQEISSGWPILSIDIRTINSMMGQDLYVGANQFVSIEEKNIDNELFKAPSGFKKTTMKDMMQGVEFEN